MIVNRKAVENRNKRPCRLLILSLTASGLFVFVLMLALACEVAL